MNQGEDVASFSAFWVKGLMLLKVGRDTCEKASHVQGEIERTVNTLVRPFVCVPCTWNR